MTCYFALLRAVNVGGTGKLLMADLIKIAVDAGFHNVKTYIASGNLVLSSGQSTQEVKALLEAALFAYAGKKVAVMVRSFDEMTQIIAQNPFKKALPNQLTVTFLDAPLCGLDIKNQTTEQVHTRGCEIYIHYPNGIATSKLRIKGLEAGTARNWNTVQKLAELAHSITI